MLIKSQTQGSTRLNPDIVLKVTDLTQSRCHTYPLMLPALVAGVIAADPYTCLSLCLDGPAIASRGEDELPLASDTAKHTHFAIIHVHDHNIFKGFDRHQRKA